MSRREDDYEEYEDGEYEDGEYEDDEYEDDEYDDDEYDDYEEEDYEDDDRFGGIVDSIIGPIMNSSPKTKMIGGVAVIILIVVMTLGSTLLGGGKGNNKMPTMVAMNMENLPLDEEGNIIEPVYDKDGDLIGIPVHPDIQSIYGDVYYFGQVTQKEEVDLDAWEKEQTGTGEAEEEEVMTEPEPELEPVDLVTKIENLPIEFYDKNPDNSKIKETTYRNLGVAPKYKSEDNFIVYNWEGNLEPLSRQGGYINREIMGRVLDFEMFTVIMDHTVNTVGARAKSLDIPVQLGQDFNRELAVRKIKSEYNKIEQEGVYKDINMRTSDYTVNYIISMLDLSSKTPENSASLFIPDAKFDVGTDEFQAFQQSLVDQAIKDASILPNGELNNEQLGKIHYKIYNYVVNARLKHFKELACEELNEFKPGMCSNKADISSLEIKSDFIQDVYTSALEISSDHYYYVMYRVYDELNKPLE